jgi:hypothetical protein
MNVIELQRFRWMGRTNPGNHSDSGKGINEAVKLYSPKRTYSKVRNGVSIKRAEKKTGPVSQSVPVT